MRKNKCHHQFLLIKSRQDISTQQTIDSLCTINDGEEFGRSFCDISSKELEFKVEHQGDHATFLNFDITIKE